MALNSGDSRWHATYQIFHNQKEENGLDGWGRRTDDAIDPLP